MRCAGPITNRPQDAILPRSAASPQAISVQLSAFSFWISASGVKIFAAHKETKTQ